MSDALKVLRHELADILGDALGVKATKLGAQLNPPAVVVQGGQPYVSALDYCTDEVAYTAVVVAPPGDPAKVADALDVLVDKVRASLRPVPATGHHFRFREVSRGTYEYSDKDWPAAFVSVSVERRSP